MTDLYELLKARVAKINEEELLIELEDNAGNLKIKPTSHMLGQKLSYGDRIYVALMSYESIEDLTYKNGIKLLNEILSGKL